MPPSDPENLSASSENLSTFARETPLTYGTWGQFKRLYKTVEANPQADLSLFATLAARLDAAPLSSDVYALPVDLKQDMNGAPSGVPSLVVSGTHVYCLLDGPGSRKRLVGYEFDPANPLDPALLGSVEVSGNSSIILCGPFICLFRGSKGVGTLSIFEPAAEGGPRWRGTLALSGYGQAVGAYPYLYVAVQSLKGGRSGLHIVDLTDPDQLQIVGEVEIKQTQQVALNGSLAAVTSGETHFNWNQTPTTGGLHLIDVSVPSRPRVLGRLDRSISGAVALRGTLAYLAGDRTSPNDSAGLTIVDISDLSRPKVRGFVATSYYIPQTITLHGDYAYLTMQYGYPLIVNISNPDLPVNAGQIKSYGAGGIAIAADTAYVGTSYTGLELYNVLNPGKPARIGTPPKGATLGYMKRRVRRFLRHAAKTNPDSYIPLAAAILGEVRASSETAFDPASQWVLADILYGGSDRFVQSRHGRGPLLATAAPRRLRAREERFPQLWNTNLETAAELLVNPALPWPVHEAMLKILQANSTALPIPSLESLAGLVGSPSLLLIHFAVPRIAALLVSGASVPPETAAQAYVKTNAARRRVIEAALSRTAGDAAWSLAFAAQVLTLAEASLDAGRLPRRFATACEMIARRDPASVPDNFVRTLADALLHTGLPTLAALVFALARRVTPPEASDWLQILDTAPESLRESVIQALAEGAASQSFTQDEAEDLVLHHGTEFGRAAGWRLLIASGTAPTVFHALWTGLLDSFQETPALRTAMTTPAALTGLARAGLSPQTIADSLRDKPFLGSLLSPETFAAILPAVPASVALSLVAAVDDDRWPDFRPFFLNRLQGGAGLAEFWNAVPSALDADGTGRLERRLLGDAEAADTLRFVDDPSLLSIRDSAFDAALGRWVRAHESLFTLNSSLLLEAATHVLPTVRAWALERVRETGLDLPFALRLLESGIPASMEVGGAFFARLPVADTLERIYALALCDSPIAGVRALGREFVTARWETLPREDLLRALFENSHPEMQAFVAELLASTPARAAESGGFESAGFDGEVLRARHTARRAKELVKARQSLESTVDVDTLLALARSRTPRDAEWALSQLARLALTGQEIEGFTVTGVAGG